jgi:hypothetical protein
MKNRDILEKYLGKKVRVTTKNKKFIAYLIAIIPPQNVKFKVNKLFFVEDIYSDILKKFILKNSELKKIVLNRGRT